MSIASPATRDHIAALGFLPSPKIIMPLAISRMPQRRTSPG